MKVLVIGANGQIGSFLVKLLNDNHDFTVKAMVRKEEQSKSFENEGIETVLADLEGTVEELAKVMKGCDAVVFTAGSGGKTGADMTLLIDLDGAVKSMEAVEKAGIDRFVMVSALQANNRENWNQAIKPYYVAKHYADRMLASSRLDYTILRPGRLINNPGTGKIKVGEKLERAMISREDVAKTIMAVLNEGKTIRKAFDLIAGDTDIEIALKNI